MKNYLVPFLFLSLAWSGCARYQPSDNNINNAFGLTMQNPGKAGNDGTSLVTLVLTKKVQEVKNGLTVTFATNRGSLLSSTVLLDSVTEARVQLKVAQDTGSYVVSATVNDGSTSKVQQSLPFNLKPACPDQISLETDASKLSLTSPLTISTLLTRKVGLVSTKTTVYFKAYQFTPANDTVRVGRFKGLLANSSDTSGKLTDIQFFSDTPNIDTTRPLTIEASAYNDNHQLIYKKVIFTY